MCTIVMGDKQHNASKVPGEIHQINNAFRHHNNPGRLAGRPTKKFVSYDSLRLEKERLETFIDWPVAWMKPEDLAKDGFFYLRTKDHCACVFCRGIVGAWEQGDSPREEHKRHFSHCPFIQGHPVGNVPLAHSNIILGTTPSMDVCGLGRHISESYPECRTPKKSDSGYSGLGLPPHTGPKRKEFLSLESRAKSFMGWPDGVKQTPKELAEAGFSYCGLSDHVRCFYCDNGLRNWEQEDDPWEEHARWYPECNFVLVKKGQEFVDRVRREKPPYLRSQPTRSKAGRSSERELDPLMQLDNESQNSLSSSSLTPTTKTSAGDEMPSSLSSSTGSSQHSPTSSSSTEEPITESSLITPTQEVLTLADQVIDTADQALNAVPTSSSSPTPNASAKFSLDTSMAVKLLRSSGDSAGTGKPQDRAVEGLDLKDTRECKVCMNAELDTVFLPCTHMVTCSSCALALTQCPICRKDIKYAIKPILS